MEKETKKHLIILILKILENESDEKHPITQKEICHVISQKFLCDRKTIGRNIKYLQEINYPIIKTSKGYYLDKKQFSVEEISFIKKVILNSEEKTIEEKNEILNKLLPLLTKIRR